MSSDASFIAIVAEAPFVTFPLVAVLISMMALFLRCLYLNSAVKQRCERSCLCGFACQKAS